MELITILLSIISVLAVLSGLAILVGVGRKDRAKAAIFFLGNLSALVWAFSIVRLLALPAGSYDLARTLVPVVYISACIMMSTLVGYFCYDYKVGKPYFILTLILTAIIGTLIVVSPGDFYSDMVIDGVSNRLLFNNCPLYIAYIGLCAFMIAGLIGGALGKIFTSRKNKHMNTRGFCVLAVGLGLTGSLAGIFDLILPMAGNYSLIWIGPLSMSAAILFHYYVVLKYRILELESKSLKILTYAVLVSVIAVVYMCVFFVIFSAMFHGAAPSAEVLILNFVMAVVMILLVPAFNEVSGELTSYVSNDKIDLPHIVKKLCKVKSSRFHVDPSELANFLAEHLHYENIWIVKGKHTWSANGEGLPEDAPKTSAPLKDEKGEAYGEIIFGKPTGRTNFIKHNRAELDAIISLVGPIISKAS